MARIVTADMIQNGLYRLNRIIVKELYDTCRDNNFKRYKEFVGFIPNSPGENDIEMQYHAIRAACIHMRTDIAKWVMSIFKPTRHKDACDLISSVYEDIYLLNLVAEHFNITKEDVTANYHMLYRIMSNKDLEMLKWLINTFHFDAEDIRSNDHIIKMACKCKNIEAVQLLISEFGLTREDFGEWADEHLILIPLL